MPDRSTAEMCTNTSGPPASGAINPKPLEGLNHLTVPVAMAVRSFSWGVFGVSFPEAPRNAVNISNGCPGRPSLYRVRLGPREETVALRLLAGDLSRATDRLRLLPCSFLRGLFVEAPLSHLTKDAFPLHLLLEDT